MSTTYTINEAGLIPFSPAAASASKDTGEEADLTLRSQRQRKVELAHEASLLNKAGRTEELKRCLETLLEIDPNDAQALYNLGLLVYRQDEKPKAERLLRRAIEHEPDYADAYLALGNMHFDSRHLLSAIEIYEAGLRQVPTRLQLLGSLLRAAATMRSAVRRADTSSMSPITTFAPTAAKSSAVAAPMPLPPPVTTATLPSSRKASSGSAALMPHRPGP